MFAKTKLLELWLKYSGIRLSYALQDRFIESCGKLTGLPKDALLYALERAQKERNFKIDFIEAVGQQYVNNKKKVAKKSGSRTAPAKRKKGAATESRRVPTPAKSTQVRNQKEKWISRGINEESRRRSFSAGPERPNDSDLHKQISNYEKSQSKKRGIPYRD